jgi:hypothetical protein
VYLGNGNGLPWYVYLIAAGVVSSPLVVHRWRIMVQRLRAIEGRDWPTVSAMIDRVFTVEEQTIPSRYGPRSDGYLVTLGYTYHNPELQVGEYRCRFDVRDEATSWANSFKGCTVMVRVDPKDPTKSVLRKEELDDAVFPTESPKVNASQ